MQPEKKDVVQQRRSADPVCKFAEETAVPRCGSKKRSSSSGAGSPTVALVRGKRASSGGAWSAAPDSPRKRTALQALVQARGGKQGMPR